MADILATNISAQLLANDSIDQSIVTLLCNESIYVWMILLSIAKASIKLRSHLS